MRFIKTIPLRTQQADGWRRPLRTGRINRSVGSGKESEIQAPAVQAGFDSQLMGFIYQ